MVFIVQVTCLLKAVCMSCSLQAASVPEWAAQLRQLRITRVKFLSICPAFGDPEDPEPGWPLRAEYTCLLRLCLSLAHALPCQAEQLTLYGWDATPDFVQALPTIPQWRELRLTVSSGGGDTVQAAMHIPTSYQKLYIEQHHDFSLKQEEVRSLVLYAPMARTADSPLHVHVQYYFTPQFGEQIEQQWHERGWHEHASITTQ